MRCNDKQAQNLKHNDHPHKTPQLSLRVGPILAEGKEGQVGEQKP